jgi:hypothetical protein
LAYFYLNGISINKDVNEANKLYFEIIEKSIDKESKEYIFSHYALGLYFEKLFNYEESLFHFNHVNGKFGYNLNDKILLLNNYLSQNLSENIEI